MSFTIRDQRPITNKGSYDVIVAGGGFAGVAAALAAAREGASTLLIEKSINLGGLGTIGLISWYEPLCDGYGKKLVGGIAEELLRLAIAYGPDSLPPEWRDGQPQEPTRKRYATFFSPTMLAMAMDGILADAGVTLLLDSLVVCPVMDEGRCRGLIVENKGGRAYYEARAFVDATGDADVLHRAGAPCADGKNYLTFVGHVINLELAAKAVEKHDILALRKWMNPGSDLWGKGHPQGMKLFTGVTAEEVTEYVLTGRRMLFDRLKDGDRFAGDVMALPSMPQLRTTRHLCGAYELTGGDIFKSAGDSIGASGDFRKPGDWYEIPYRCLYHPDYENLLAAGRIVSASGDGWEVTRVIPVAALTGQAAGIAAALCAASGKAAGGVDIAALQQKLEITGVLIHNQ